MRRGLWFSAGIAAGVYGTFRARRAAEAFTADGIGDRMKAATLGARMFRDELAQGVADAEIDLRHRYGLPSLDEGPRALEAPSAAPTSQPRKLNPKDNR